MKMIEGLRHSAAVVVTAALTAATASFAAPDLLVRLLDGDWKSDQGTYDISDVETHDDIATFYFTREKKLGRGRPGDRFDRKEGEKVICQGTGTFDPDSKLMSAQEVCPTHMKDKVRIAHLIYTMEFKRTYSGGKLKMVGKRVEQFASTDSHGELAVDTRNAKDEELVREKERDNGPRWRHRDRDHGDEDRDHDRGRGRDRDRDKDKDDGDKDHGGRGTGPGDRERDDKEPGKGPGGRDRGEKDDKGGDRGPGDRGPGGGGPRR